MGRRIDGLVTRPLPALATAALLAAGCGGGDGGGEQGTGGAARTSTTSTQASTATTGSPGKPGPKGTGVAMKEFAFVPANVSARAGQVVIAARNRGRVPHELVLLKADRPPGALPVDGSRAAEHGAGVKLLGRTGRVSPGASGRLSAKLRPGAYVMICNLPGHYRSGMYGSFTVK